MRDFPMEWLDPILDRCRSELIEHLPRSSVKTLDDGRVEPVTDLDLRIEGRLIAAALEAYPSADIFSEETHCNPAALASELCFVIDPIDGTKELIAGTADFAISVALFQQGKPVAGVLDLPFRGQRFTCTAEGGARVNGIPVYLQAPPHLRAAKLAVSPTQRADPSLASVWTRLLPRGIAPVGAFTPKVAQVLCGDCHAALYPPKPGKSIFLWDYAAAALLLAEAGGMLMSLDGMSLLNTLPLEHSGGWVAGPADLCREIRLAMRETESA
ncbi:inositol monophosphatase family protein [Streptomyces sp. NPDC005492]|uniref:inositol monophosphatase family protein n=1 Tax=Streptomyces sp. NPDC005492 TaxID=3156883 RepID=UPI0033B9221A